MNIDQCVEHVTDPRQSKNKKHTLSSLMLIVFSSIVSGYDTPESMVEFAKLKLDWLRTFTPIESVPCAETLRFFICAINPDELIKGFGAFVQESSEGDFISLDGKTMRGTRHGTFDAIHMVSAWSKKQGITLSSLKSKNKSNEIKTIPKLLDLIDVKGAIITIDAMGCQTDIASRIRDKGADYILQIKKNQKSLYAEIEAYFHKIYREKFEGITHEIHEDIDKGHGRIEQRIAHHIALNDWVSSAARWPDAKTFVRLERKTITAKGERSEISWYLCSIDINAGRAADAIRSHWGVENNLHWQLDVTFKEDKCLMASGGEAIAIIKRFCMNLLKLNDTSKRRMKHRVMAAAIDDDYRTKILLSG